MKLRRSLLAAMLALGALQTAEATNVYPIDRAEMLAGSRFDFKVEFDGVLDASALRITINGEDYRQILPRAEWIAKEDGKDNSSLLLRNAHIDKPGTYIVAATDGKTTKTVRWQVYATPAKPEAKNVILFIGDGLSVAHRTAARIMSKGIVEGKYQGKLAIDDMPHMALVSTAGTDSVVTDSANAAHAYTTGHKSCVNALGVYCSRAAKSLDHPKVETIAELVKRNKGMAVGIVTNSEIEDATPAAMVSHTRRRSDYNDIVKMLFDSQADVIMGGGSPNFLPKSTLGSKRTDEVDYLDRFQKAGYTFTSTNQELQAAASQPSTTKLLGLFNTSNIDGALDLKFLKKGTVNKFPDQPDVPQQMEAALKVLSRNPKGFVLLVESARIDKYSHSLDPERAVYDTIMLDNAVQKAKDWASKRNDTLIMVVADHAHPISLIGTVNDEATGKTMREKVGTYEEAGYPNYPAPDAEGYPNKVDVSRRLRLVFGATPDYYDTYQPHLEGENVPTIKDANGVMVANPRYKDVAGAELRIGNIPSTGPRAANSGIHSGDDVILTGTGPGSEQIHGQMENTDVFRVMANALALSPAPQAKSVTSKKVTKKQ